MQEMTKMGSATNYELSEIQNCSGSRETCVLLPMRWKLMCTRRSCPNSKEEWTDYYGFSVAGGYEHGQLLYVRNTDWGMRSRHVRKLKQHDILLEANGYKLAGACTYFVYAIMKKLWEENIVLQLAVLPGNYLKNNFDLIQFLQDNTFPHGSLEQVLQLEIRLSVYRQYPPVTSRPPSDDEREKKYPYNKYFFWTEKHVAEDLGKHRFLERGEYEGHFYGTVIPITSCNVAATFEEAIDWLDNPNPTRRMSFKKAIGMLPANYDKEVPEDDLNKVDGVL